MDDATSQISVASIVPDSPAKRADLKEGDVLLKVAGVKANKLLSTVDAIRKIKPGNELVISLRRGDLEKEITVKADLFPFRLSGILD